MHKIEELDASLLYKFIKEYDESYELEYKEIYGNKSKKEMEKQLLKSVLRIVVAFANSNAECGRLILGVKDETKEINGVPSEVTLERLSDLINDKIRPTPFFKIQEYLIENKKIIVIDTFQSNERPYIVEGVVYKRMGHSSKMVTDYREIKSLEETIISKARSWITNENNSDEPRLCYTFAPIYTNKIKFSIDKQAVFLQYLYDLGLKIISPNTYIYTTSDYTIEVNINYKTIKVVTNIANYQDTIEKVTNIAKHLYDRYEYKKILFASNILFNSAPHITINNRTLQRGLNYKIEMKSENIYLDFGLLLNNYFFPEEADKLFKAVIKSKGKRHLIF